MNRLVTQAGLSEMIHCDSAGTSGYHEGEPADARMISHAKDRGYELSSLSRPFIAPDDFEKFDFILTMDESNFRNIVKLDPEGKYHNKIIPMVKFCNQHDVREVPDPYYKGDDGFQLVIDILEDACSQLLAHIRKGLKT
jgi:protein-tyrosine phosphatase